MRTFIKNIGRAYIGYAKAIVNDPDLAKDLAQDTFITVWEQLPKFRGEAAIGSWIFRIAVNKCLKNLEKEKRFHKVELPEQLQENTTEDNEPQLKLLQQFISELSESDRIIILLELEDLPQVEIAGIVGLTESNIRVKIHRIKQKLTQKFKDHGN